ncbi:E3 ubiquitin-protein ligase TRIM39 isoform X1 [Ictalurus punctatus]|uniref:E3 ubiquitin-protein ligase TRIM39 isoform X1 n=2 Tax=Ictalurus punctatus TaxID=7998 RepID=A0A9F7RDZ5_ICTPU|nr:E3 ubiquitin-protein ligase TRIM39 isoform X1 [Ictalurus punctatus]
MLQSEVQTFLPTPGRLKRRRKEDMNESLSSQLRQGRRNSMGEPVQFAGESRSLLTEEQLQCSICLEVFTDPVTTPCGHSFCNSCLTQSWDTSQYYYCPYCKEKFTKRPEIKINITLREVADRFKKKTVSDKFQILCDFCTDVKQKALKSCLDCGVTLCSSHLESHNNVPKYKKHKLINAVENVDKYIYQEHERPLEMFCRDDQKCVCRFCTVTDHKNHKVPLEEESGDRKLGKTPTELQQIIQERLKKIQEINHSVELSKRNTEKGKSDSIQVFTALIRSIKRSQAELLEVMERKQKAAEKQAEGLIKDLQQEIDELKRRDTELEQLSHTDYHLHLLQIYPSLCIAPHTKNWTEIRINTELSEEALTTALSQLQKTLNEKLSVTLNEKLKEKVSTELKRIQQYAVDVTLDPDTANYFLILSDDGKQVTCGDKKQNLPDTPKRFTYNPVVLGNQGFTLGRFYYEVQVSRKTVWDLGVVRESVNRKGKISLSPQDGFCAVALRKGNEYTACDDPCISLSLREKPQKVGVFVDYDEGLVSFYDIEARSHIYSFTGQSFTEKLYPYFSPCPNDGGKNSAPLIISRL